MGHMCLSDHSHSTDTGSGRPKRHLSGRAAASGQCGGRTRKLASNSLERAQYVLPNTLHMFPNIPTCLLPLKCFQLAQTLFTIANHPV